LGNSLMQEHQNKPGIIVLNKNKILGISSLAILCIILARLSLLGYGIPNEVISGINLSIIALCLIFIFIFDKGILKLLPIPIFCSVAIFVSSAYHGFEFHRGAIFTSFLGQLYSMYLFRFLTQKFSTATFRITLVYGLFMALVSLVFIVFSITYFQGFKVATTAAYSFRAVSGFYVSSSYHALLAFLIISSIVFSQKIQGRNLLVLCVFMLFLILSSNRITLICTAAAIVFAILVSKRLGKILKIFLLVILLMLMAVLFFAWVNSPFNYKSIDSGRLLIYYKLLNVIKESFWLGASQLMLDSRTYIAQGHNFYLVTLAEYGIFVLLGYLAYLFWFFYNSSLQGKFYLILVYLIASVDPAVSVGFSEYFFLYLTVAIFINTYNRENKLLPEEDLIKTQPKMITIPN
jgi:hypothetical protein